MRYNVLKNKIKAAVFYLLIALWTAVMFSLSGQTAEASSRLSGGLTDWLMALLPEGMISFELLEHLLRKTAHFCMFAMEGALMYMSLYLTFRHRKRAMVLAMGASVVIATLNELHQLMFEGRSCEFLDVVINSAGACAGIAAAILAYHCYLLIRSRRQA